MEIAVNIGLYLAYALVVVAALGALVLPLVSAIQNPKSLQKLGLALVAIGLVFLVCYFISGNEVLPVYEKYGVNADASKVIGGILATMYTLMFLCIGAVVYTEVSKVTK